MKLELKHLAPYLPYGLKIQGTTHGEIAELSCCTETSVNITSRTFQYGMWADIFEVKPILRPLSDLTREDLIEDLGTETSCLDWTTSEREHWIKFYSREHWINNLPYLIYSHLLKHHFDVFGLIEAELAIDINTLNK